MRGQIMIEFIMMMALALLFFLIILIVANAYVQLSEEERSRRIVDDYATVLQQELLLAAGAQDGYTRSISIPDRLQGREYSLTVTSITLSIELLDSGASATRSIPPINGTLTNGTNTLHLQDGIVHIEQAP